MKKTVIPALALLAILTAAPVSAFEGAWGNGSDSNGGVGDTPIDGGGLGSGSTSNGGVSSGN